MQCIPCYFLCMTCQGTAEYCSTCIVSASHNESLHLCYCRVGLYPDSVSSKCENCPQNCLVCERRGQCTSCISTFNLEEQSRCECPFYINLAGKCCPRFCRDCMAQDACLLNQCLNNLILAA
jgi:proprotein convertase subtilisin/kexin type 5